MTASMSSMIWAPLSCVAQIVSPSPSVILTISGSEIGPMPEIWTASYPIALIFFSVPAKSAGVLTKSRTV